MEPTQANLVVRQHERHRCDLPAMFSVDPAQNDRVVIALQTTGLSAGEVNVRLIDCSMGGLGLKSPVYIPKNGRLRVQMDLGDGGPHLDATIRVQRAMMQDRTPSYYLGGAFTEESEIQTAAMQRLFGILKSQTASALAGGPTSA